MTFLRKILLSLKVFWLFLKRKKTTFLIFLFLITVLSVGIFTLKDDIVRSSITEGIVGTYTEKDLPVIVTSLLSQSLFVSGKNGFTKPNLASSLQTNNDATVFTVTLKNNLHWVDGTDLTTQDIEFSIPDVEVKTRDNKTIEFKLADSFSPFPTLLTKPIFKKNTNIGLGPYRIESIQKDKIFIKKIMLKPVGKDMPDIVIRFYPNERIAKEALRLGEVHVLLGVQELEDLQKEKTLNMISKPNYQQLVTIFYNTKDPVLSDENLRTALSFQAPSIKGEAEAKSPIPPFSFAFRDDVRDYLDNYEQARLSFTKVRKTDKIVLTSTNSLKGVGEQVIAAWKKLGVDAVLRVESGVPQNFQALLIAQNIPLDPDQYSLWHSTQALTNISKFSSPRVDKDLEDGRKIIDPEVRKQKYQDFQKVLLDHPPATFLYFPKYNIVYRKKVEGMLTKIIKLQLPQFFQE
ncbi:ABC transporter substrate-binding protein [Candidatus Daviesbacteria bacterium]|nr:ABC transporter substrate-binding protein [Candidatus Daviesbacteria bacterium]